MKTLFIIMLIGALAYSQEKKETFVFAGIEYTVQERSIILSLDAKYSITCHKEVKGQSEQYLFITSGDYTVLRFYAYKEQRWYDVSEENIKIELTKK